MFKMKINEAECIIERFFDGGESYSNNEKYSPLSEYKVACPDGATVFQDWLAVQITIPKLPKGKVTISKNCMLKVGKYDNFLISCIRSNCIIQFSAETEDGLIEYTAAENGKKEISIPLRTKFIKSFSLSFSNNNPNENSSCSLIWLGLSNSENLEIINNHDDFEFTGCLQDPAEFKPQIGIYIREEQYADFLRKIKKEPFSTWYQTLKDKAYSEKDRMPEKEVGEYILNNNKWCCRDRDMCADPIFEVMHIVALVAMVEKDRDLMTLACRMALAVSATHHWTEGFMGDLPLTTWHHRSFLEGLVSKRCAMVLDWAGSALTWHGKNIIYDAMMQKGLPRMEADLNCFDYLYHCNQGMVFNDDRIHTYIALAQKYPRYKRLIKNAEEDFLEMINTCFTEDGGYVEGPGYFSYTFENVVTTASILANYYNKPLRDYVTERIKKTADYALSMFSDVGNGRKYFMINDCYGYFGYTPTIYDFYTKVTGDKVWNSYYKMAMEDAGKGGSVEPLLLNSPVQSSMELCDNKEFISLNTIGETAVRFNTPGGKALLHITAGKAYYSHFHGDKGSILLDVDGEHIFIDKGNASNIAKLPQSHNLFSPENQSLVQTPETGGRVICSEFKNGILNYCADLTSAWEKGIFKKITRNIATDENGTLILTDNAICEQKTAMNLRFHTYGEISESNGVFTVSCNGKQVEIIPKNKPDSFEIFADDPDVCKTAVNCLSLCYKAELEHNIKTLIKVKG